jgi:hypothetical protein
MPSHSFRVTVPDQPSEILTVQVFLEAHIENPYVNDSMEVQVALPSEAYGDATYHEYVTDLPDFQGPENEDLMRIDITNDRPWTWADLNARQIRVKTIKQGGPDGIYLNTDAIGYRVIAVAPTRKGILTWNE